MSIRLIKIKMIIRDIYYLIYKIKRFFINNSYEVYFFYVHPAVKIGDNVIIRKYCYIAQGIEIGEYTFINEYTRIKSSISSIGKYCSISHNVKIGMLPHPLDLISTSPVFYSTNRKFVNSDLITYDEKSKIGNDVFIASIAIILYNVNIGHSAVISAGSVVTKDVPPYAIAGGIPPKIIKYRFEKEEIRFLLNLKWWDKNIYELFKYKNYMLNPNKLFNDSINYAK